jgi:hypothetical protein
MILTERELEKEIQRGAYLTHKIAELEKEINCLKISSSKCLKIVFKK